MRRLRHRTIKPSRAGSATMAGWKASAAVIAYVEAACGCSFMLQER